MDASHLQSVGLVPKGDTMTTLDCEIVVQVRQRDDATEHREQMSREQLLRLLITSPELLRSRYGHIGFQKVQELLGREGKA